MTKVATPTMTNERFAELVGCHFTMASRLRNGNRLPSLSLMQSIHEAFNLPYDDLMSAYKLGAAAFGQYLRLMVFQDAA